MWQGSRVMRYPYMYIPSNAGAAAEAGVILPSEVPAAEEAIEVSLYKDPKNPAGGVTLSQAISLDVIATQARDGWNRPAYFAMTVPDEYYLSLSPYMRNTGLAYQVTPLRNPEDGQSTWIATDKMYDNITTKFRWGGLDKLNEGQEVYLDETVRRMVTTHRSAMSELAYALFLEGYDAMHPTDSVNGKPDAVYAADRFTKAAHILDLIDEKLPTSVAPYSIQIGYQIADTYLKLAQATGDDNLKAKGLAILEKEILRYGQYLPYFMELQRTLPGSGYSGLTYADRYIPTYLYVLLDTYNSEGGDSAALQEKLLAEGVNINDLTRFLPKK